MRFEIIRLLPEWEKHIPEIRKILEEENSEGITKFVLMRIGKQALLTIWPEAQKRFPWLFINK